MKILLLYRSNGISNSIVSSTMHKFETMPIEGIEVERFNISKRSIKKYLKKANEDNSLPDVIYVYADDSRLTTNEIPGTTKKVHEVIYDRRLVYKPSRVPGNKLKTIVYYLYEKILSDTLHKYETRTTYKPNISKLEVEEIVTDVFSYEYPMCSNHYKGRDTREEAEAEIRQYLTNQTKKYEKLIEQSKQAVINYEAKLAETKLKLDEIIK